MPKGQKFSSDKPTIEEIRRLKKPNRRSVFVLVDPEIAREIKNLERAYAQEKRIDVKENRNPEAPAILKKLEELRDVTADYEVEFIFEDIGRKALEDLVIEHPPTPEQKADMAEIEFNSETFPPALMAATAIEPEMTLEDAEALFNDWSSGEAEILFMTAMMACRERASIPFTRTDTEGILDSASNLITAVSEDSPMDGSLAGN